jgi:hypothetical protein
MTDHTSDSSKPEEAQMARTVAVTGGSGKLGRALPEYADFPSFENEPASRTWNLWSYIDARDGAQAVVRALEYDKFGFDNFVIANADTVMSRPSKELIAEFFPETQFRGPVEGTHSLCSTEKARRLLGWKPQHSWRDHASA